MLLLLRDIAVPITRFETWGDDIIVSQNMQIGCTHEYVRVAFSDLSTLGPGLKKKKSGLDEMPIRQLVCKYS